MNEKTFTRAELADILGIAETTLAKKDKEYLKECEYEKKGRGKKSTYIFQTPPPISPKVKIEKVLGFKSKRAKDMDKYLKFMFEHTHGFIMADEEVAKIIKTTRPRVAEVRKELENHNFLTPIKEEEKQPYKLSVWEEFPVLEMATKKEWNKYWYTYRENLYIANKTGTVEDAYGVHSATKGMIHIATSQELGYRVSFKYKRETFFPHFLSMLMKYQDYWKYCAD